MGVIYYRKVIILKYNIGDFVKVIHHYDHDASYYNDFPCVVPEMNNMCGNCYEIIDIDDEPACGECPVVRLGDYWFSEEMIEGKVLAIKNDDKTIFLPFSDDAV